ncbi:hypothetical protein AMJ82_08710 [candidate division TA06 bacterium SM23_40]|uniref:Uncharacterized protein n=1 Tax=candidate division TA06 bacterium SM23_40 TaxID=1703774 RepID=A0A0S8G942_UNCT6|nr:MAG: hypothetical protein AMJ82_08710 [candidate division TA06 bacterium SM23_40]
MGSEEMEDRRKGDDRRSGFERRKEELFDFRILNAWNNLSEPARRDIVRVFSSTIDRKMTPELFWIMLSEETQREVHRLTEQLQHLLAKS